MQEPSWRLIEGDCRSVCKTLPDGFVQTVVTSPPYLGLRDYGHPDQVGLEPTPEAYVQTLVEVFREIRRLLRDDGTVWLNLGDTFNAYNGGAGPGSQLSATQSDQRPRLATGYGLQVKSLKPKDLIGVPWMVAFALRADGWWLRSEIIWHKLNPMPESIKDRPTKSHEQIFLLSKSARYHYNADAIAEHATWAAPNGAQHSPYAQNLKPWPGIGAPTAAAREDTSTRGADEREQMQTQLTRNKRSVWTVATQPFLGAHFATMPPKLVEPCVLAGCPEGGVVLDPFAGAGTTGVVALRHNRSFVGIELSPAYATIARERIRDDQPLFNWAREEQGERSSSNTRRAHDDAVDG